MTPERLSTRRAVLMALGGGIGLAAAGCASLDTQPKTLQVKFSVEADSSINPNDAGEPSPVVVRVYELKSLSGFQQAQFFELLDNDAQKLGADLVSKREFEMKPGDKQNLDRTTSVDTHFIGVIAGFRNIDQATWRASAELMPDTPTNIVIKLTAQTVSIETTAIKKFGLF